MKFRWAVLGLGLLAQPALAVEVYRFPLCEGRPVVAVPVELQGTFYTPPDRQFPDGRLTIVGPEGVENHHLKMRYTLETDDQIRRSRLCRYSELVTDPQGKMYLITTLHRVQNDWGYEQENTDFRVSYDPVTRRNAESFRANAFVFLLWFIPAGVATGWVPELPLLRIANAGELPALLPVEAP